MDSRRWTVIGFLLALATGAPDARATSPLTRHPYLQSLGTDRVVMMWRSATPAVHVVEYGIGPVYSQSASSPLATTDHEVLLTGLQPGTRYTYRIREDTTILLEEPSFCWFRTDAGKSDTDYSFFVCGDVGEPPPDGFQHYTEQRIRGMSPAADFGLLTGDLVYPDGESAVYDLHLMTPWRELLRNTPVWPVPGNHDWHVDPETNYRREWALPNNEHYYSFDYGTAHFIGLDTAEGELYDEANQLAWLRADLMAARGRYQWTFVYYHHPLITCTYKGNEEELAAKLLPIFDEFRVDMCFTGHAHTYERLFPMRNRVSVAQDQSPRFTDPPGTIYVVSGCGGKFKSGEPTTLCGPTAAFHDERPMFAQVYVFGQTLYLFAIDGITGEIHDWMQLTKTKSVSDATALPLVPRLAQNVPNPFNPTTTISFDLPAPERVGVRVLRPDGSLVTTLADRRFPAGSHLLRWDGRDASGTASPSGLYLCRLESGTHADAIKMILLR